MQTVRLHLPSWPVVAFAFAFIGEDVPIITPLMTFARKRTPPGPTPPYSYPANFFTPVYIAHQPFPRYICLATQATTTNPSTLTLPRTPPMQLTLATGLLLALLDLLVAGYLLLGALTTAP